MTLLGLAFLDAGVAIRTEACHDRIEAHVPHKMHVSLQVFTASLTAELKSPEGTGELLRHLKSKFGEPVHRALGARAARLSQAA